MLLDFLLFFWLSIGEDEIVVVEQVLCFGWIIIGLKNQEFEQCFVECFGCCYVVVLFLVIGVLYVILLVLGIGFGDEVIMLLLIWVFIVNVIILFGVILVFVDVDGDILMCLVQVVEVVIGLCICVIVLVYYVGFILDFEGLCMVVGCYGIVLVEDVVYVVGSEYCGCLVGFCGMVIFFFYVIKNLICVEGVMFVSDDSVFVEWVCCFKFYGFGVDVYDCLSYGCKLQVEVIEFGFKYNLVDFNVVFVLVQFKCLDVFNVCCQVFVECYLECFVGLLLVLFGLFVYKQCYVWYLFILCIDVEVCGLGCDVFMEVLKVCGIGSGIYFIVSYLYYYYCQCQLCLSLFNSEWNLVCLCFILLFFDMCDDDIECVVCVIEEILEKC